MKTQKAGCFLINTQTKSVALVYREKQKDWSFPKGHMEDNETPQECAVRETAEETKRDCKIVDNNPYIEEYTTPKGEECVCYMYIAVDVGKSNNDSTDTHETHWVKFDKVEETLSYPNLKKTWNDVKDRIGKLL